MNERTPMSQHTPGPWRWKGEDYRGDWGWQILVGPNGEGIIVGGDGNNPSEHLKVGMPVDPSLCITGIAAHGKPRVHPVHVYGQANAKLIVAAPMLFEACRQIIDTFEGKSGLEFVEHMALDKAVEAVEAVVGELHDHSKD